MLTRCQAGLVVVTSRSFLHGGGWDTLLGRLARHWEGRRGNDAWVEWRSVANEQVDLPGAPGRKKVTNHFGFINRPSATVPFSAQTTSSFRVYPSAPTPGRDDTYAGIAASLALDGPSRHFSVNLQNSSPVQPFRTRKGHTPSDEKPQPYRNYDKVYPSLQAANPTTTTPLSTTTSHHSLLHSKTRPLVASQPQGTRRPQSTPPRHPPSVRFPRHAPVEPKAPGNPWPPVANNRREKKYNLTRSSYRL